MTRHGYPLYSLLWLPLLAASLSACSTETPTFDPTGTWDLKLTFTRESGQQEQKTKQISILNVQDNGYFASESFYWSVSAQGKRTQVTGSTRTGQVILQDVFTYESDGAKDDAVCQGTFTGNTYTGTCALASQIDFGWTNFKLAMTRR